MTTVSRDAQLVPPLAGPGPVAPPSPVPISPGATAPRSRLERLWRGRPDDSPWVRPALLGLLAATGVLYLWGLGASGWANAFYSAAVQAGTQSWKAMLFGSSDAANFITVDKPPASLWPMEIAARIFGVSSWSILVPQALMGVASVGLLYLAVRRWATPTAGLIAGAVLAVTPVATLMFRFNNPDALLVLLLTAAAYTTVRATERASTRWLVATGVLVGLAFLTKSLQAFLPLPAFALVYLVAAPTTARRRILDLLAGGAALVVSAGWWVALVELWPASSRPYVGGSQTNSVLELILGYNGLGRITGDEVGSVTGGAAAGGGVGAWGATGWGRLFSADYGGQVGWLVPAALAAAAALLWLTRRAPRTDRTRAATCCGCCGSSAPASPSRSRRASSTPTTRWRWRPRSAPSWASARPGSGPCASTRPRAWRSRSASPGRPSGERCCSPAPPSGCRGCATPSSRSASAAHWRSSSRSGSPAARRRPWRRPRSARSCSRRRRTPCRPPRRRTPGRSRAPVRPSRALAASVPVPVASPAGRAGSAASAELAGRPADRPSRADRGSCRPGRPGRSRAGRRAAVAPAACSTASTPGSALTALLEADSGSYTWVAAAVGAQSAAGYQLATGLPVMSLGGFNGSDPWPTLAVFQGYVASHQVHWFIGGGGFGAANGGSSATSEISSWVAANFTARTVDGVTVYDLTAPTSGTATSAGGA